MNWNDLAKEVHRDAVDKGEWDKPRTLDDVICDCLVHLSNAYTAWKDGRPNVYHLCVASGDKRDPCELDLGKPCELATGELTCDHLDPKPQGVAVELADCVLRLLDYLATTSWQYTFYPTRVELEDSFAGFLCSLHFKLTCARAARFVAEGSAVQHIFYIISTILTWAKWEGIDLESILRAKHAYNKTRSATRKRIATDGPERRGETEAAKGGCFEPETEGSGSGHAPNGSMTRPYRHGDKKL